MTHIDICLNKMESHVITAISDRDDIIHAYLHFGETTDDNIVPYFLLVPLIKMSPNDLEEDYYKRLQELKDVLLRELSNIIKPLYFTDKHGSKNLDSLADMSPKPYPNHNPRLFINKDVKTLK